MYSPPRAAYMSSLQSTCVHHCIHLWVSKGNKCIGLPFTHACKHTSHLTTHLTHLYSHTSTLLMTTHPYSSISHTHTHFTPHTPHTRTLTHTLYASHIPTLTLTSIVTVVQFEIVHSPRSIRESILGLIAKRPWSPCTHTDTHTQTDIRTHSQFTEQDHTTWVTN